jgi:hypothetical protein
MSRKPLILCLCLVASGAYAASDTLGNQNVAGHPAACNDDTQHSPDGGFSWCVYLPATAPCWQIDTEVPVRYRTSPTPDGGWFATFNDKIAFANTNTRLCSGRYNTITDGGYFVDGGSAVQADGGSSIDGGLANVLCVLQGDAGAVAISTCY